MDSRLYRKKLYDFAAPILSSLLLNELLPEHFLPEALSGENYLLF